MNLDDLNKLLGDKNVHVSGENMPKAYADCGKLSKANLGNPDDDHLPVYLGVDKKDPNKYYFSLGPSNPYHMHKNEVIYLIGALKELLKHNEGNISDTEFEKLVTDSNATISIADGFTPAPDSDIAHSKELADMINDVGTEKEEDKSGVEEKESRSAIPTEILKKVKELAKKLTGKDLTDEEVKDLEAQQQDVKEVMNNMTPEEIEELNQQMAKEKRDEVYARAKELEKELLGDIKAEEDVVYDYDHFVKIYEKDRSVQALKEEMAKLPKAERSTMITKIVEEFNKREEDHLNTNE